MSQTAKVGSTTNLKAAPRRGNYRADFEPETDLWFSALNISLSYATQVDILIKDLKTFAFYDALPLGELSLQPTMDSLFLACSETEESCKLDVMGRYNATFVGSIEHLPGRGIKPLTTASGMNCSHGQKSLEGAYMVDSVNQAADFYGSADNLSRGCFFTGNATTVVCAKETVSFSTGVASLKPRHAMGIAYDPATADAGGESWLNGVQLGTTASATNNRGVFSRYLGARIRTTSGLPERAYTAGYSALCYSFNDYTLINPAELHRVFKEFLQRIGIQNLD